MKKSLLLIAAVALLAGACSQYTCPTYSKADNQNKKVTTTEVRNF